MRKVQQRIRPTADNVVLERKDGVSDGDNRIILPNHLEDERKGWFVVAIGPDVKRCNVGDQIAFNSSTEAAKMELGDKEYVVMTEKDIVGIIE